MPNPGVVLVLECCSSAVGFCRLSWHCGGVPVLDLVLPRESSPDSPKSVCLNKKPQDALSFQLIRNIKKLFLSRRGSQKMALPVNPNPLPAASPDWDCACDRASVSPSGQLERECVCVCVRCDVHRWGRALLCSVLGSRAPGAGSGCRLTHRLCPHPSAPSTETKWCRHMRKHTKLSQAFGWL